MASSSSQCSFTSSISPTESYHTAYVTEYSGDFVEGCSLHLYSVTTPHNFGRIFSSPAPGIVMGVGSIGDRLLPYDECDTFLSTDAGITWKMVAIGARKYEFGDQGSILVTVDDEDGVSEVRWSSDLGNSWYVPLSSEYLGSI